MQRAVDLGELGLQCLDLGVGEVLLECGLTPAVLVGGEAGQALGALQKHVLLLDGLIQRHPPSLQLGAKSLHVADGTLGAERRGTGGERVGEKGNSGKWKIHTLKCMFKMYYLGKLQEWRG